MGRRPFSESDGLELAKWPRWDGDSRQVSWHAGGLASRQAGRQAGWQAGWLVAIGSGRVGSRKSWSEGLHSFSGAIEALKNPWRRASLARPCTPSLVRAARYHRRGCLKVLGQRGCLRDTTPTQVFGGAVSLSLRNDAPHQRGRRCHCQSAHRDAVAIPHQRLGSRVCEGSQAALRTVAHGQSQL